jgi:hypothetical protein
VNLDDEERALVVKLAEELKELLTADGDPSPIVARLFPAVYADDPEKEAEYQRLMRDELVTSRVAQIDTVIETLGPDGPRELDDAEAVALMQSVNAVRVVLGTMLDITEDDEPDPDSSPEHALYNFLSWVLEWTVRSLSAR